VANLSIPQLVALAQQAGFSGDSAAIAAAVAVAESGGNPRARNPISSATGLWQIMQSVHSVAHPTWTFAWLYVPQNNAHAAYVVSSGGHNWKPWVTYTSGAYLRFLPSARRVLGGSGASAAPATAAAAPSPAGSAPGSSFDPNVWLRIAMFLAGAALLLAAGIITTKAGKLVRYIK
jgi:hypothetical protein